MDILSIFHFLIYFALAFYLNDNYILMTIMGISWEIFEYTITNVPQIRDFLIKNWPIPEKYWQENVRQNKKKTETGLVIPWLTETVPLRMEDLLFNTLGYYCGVYVSKMK